MRPHGQTSPGLASVIHEPCAGSDSSSVAASAIRVNARTLEYDSSPRSIAAEIRGSDRERMRDANLLVRGADVDAALPVQPVRAELRGRVRPAFQLN